MGMGLSKKQGYLERNDNQPITSGAWQASKIPCCWLSLIKSPAINLQFTSDFTIFKIFNHLFPPFPGQFWISHGLWIPLWLGVPPWNPHGTNRARGQAPTCVGDFAPNDLPGYGDWSRETGFAYLHPDSCDEDMVALVYVAVVNLCSTCRMGPPSYVCWFINMT